MIALLKLSKPKTFFLFFPVDTGRKLNVHKTSRTSFERLLYVQFTSCVYWIMSESKADASFPKYQLEINGYICYRNDRKKYGGGLMFYISKGVPCKVLTNLTVSPDAEMIAIECHQMKCKWLLFSVYKPPIQSDSEFTEEIFTTMNHYIPSLLGDLNMTTENFYLNNLMQVFNLNALIKTPTCYQSYNPTCIDNILTN